MVDTALIQRLRTTANECRMSIISMLEKAGSGHPGTSLSCIDILVTLFFHEMKWDPKNPAWEDRDRFVLSKGHGVPALYAVLARAGAIPTEELDTLRRTGARLQGHPDRVKMPVVEASTGSLGQGLSIAQGIALALKHQKRAARSFCVIGDGECQEGQIWEAVMSAPKFKLNNLVVFLDNNNGQIDGHVTEVMDINPIPDKFRAFRWAVHDVNGHDFEALIGALEAVKQETEKPTMIVCRTVKGKGVSFMENNVKWHGVAPNQEEAARALEELRSKVTS